MQSLPTDYQSFIHASRYARYRYDLRRREVHEESISRYLDFMVDHLDRNHGYRMPTVLYSELYDSITGLHVMPSMRALMTAGPALERCHVGAYNCSALPIDSPESFDEALYILMCGAGVGFSVEDRFIDRLPTVSKTFEISSTTIMVADSKEGWGYALRQLIQMLYAGQIPQHDTSRVRPKGAVLKTFGGRASGPEPLIELFEFCIEIFRNAAGRKLTSIECYDILCKIGEIVIVGGVRRAALLSLSDVLDEAMRDAKSGNWRETHPHRELTNNSWAWASEEKPDMGIFMQEWTSLYLSKSGERGIFNRSSAERQAARNGRRETGYEWLVNPCSEILLRPYGFCNLSEMVARDSDGRAELLEKARLASIIGTFQASLTNFRYLRDVWKRNAEEERLLGASITGILDCGYLRDATEDDLAELREQVVSVNADYAVQIGIKQAAAATCVKPSGTVSQYVDSASGIHARHAHHYIRRVRGDLSDPMTKFMMSKGIPWEPCASKPEHVVVFSFPQKAPADAITRNDMSAIEQLEMWLKFQRGWCEHKPSITVSVCEHEWMEVGAWVWKHFDEVSGIAFLPHSDHSYRQAPYEEITRDAYEQLISQMPSKIDWTELARYEEGDHTTGGQTLACTANACEIVDIA